ncbi:phosphate/phosphite/phosphonate ABC transporter substrate-binding protein [Peptoniphilus stercorisuis]|uniref:Phosphonate transport system substrate-binding protein n=1 Tax=Peptoniphilus stercorisuis TaxID=1436965 RepID=A0ABS4KFE8_9FIRM|nr:PhnD/SsuA/transferrin family substrate-binding protein [Peptoniphilus stercorisuis]MBP2025369.1 phosphonate transport system substrate-binding protein [Peptoniphilus stercorisuis]
MKKTTFLLACVLALATLVGCGNNKDVSSAEGDNTIETLKVQFVPSRDPKEITTQTEPLKEILKKELSNEGFEVNNIDISVGTSFESTGEALAAGTVDVGFIPGSTYVLYDDGADVILTATRNALSTDNDDPKFWNENKPSKFIEDQTTYYRTLIIAGPSEKGQELSAKVNNGEKLTWEDLNSAKWSVMGSSSPAGYIYPYIWLQNNFDKGITDLATTVQSDSYASAAARLASGQVDIVVGYSDLRLDYEDQWKNEFGRNASIWDETNVIGVSDKIYNDTISVSKNSKIMNDDFKKALSNAFINIGNSEEGKEIIAIYNHNGYKEADSADYDSEREAQKLLKELKNN